MSSLLEECPSLLLGVNAYTHQELVEILKQPACQQIAAAILSSSTPSIDKALLSQRSSTHIGGVTGQNSTVFNETLIYLTMSAIESNEMDLSRLDAKLFMTAIFLVLSLIGIIGNLMVITVVLKVPGMITPTNCYLMSLAASDCLFFVAACPTELTTIYDTSGNYVFGSLGCAVLSYIPYLAINTSSLSITAFTIERYICTVSRAKLIIVIIWVFSIIYNSPWLYLASVVEVENEWVCDFKLDRDFWAYKLMFFFDFTTFYVIPMILYVFIYTKITYTLMVCSLGSENRKSFRKTLSSGEATKTNGVVISEDYLLHTYSVSSMQQQPLEQKKSLNATMSDELHQNSFTNAKRKGSSRGRIQIQVIKMLAVVVIIFAVCWFPYRAMVMYNSFVSEPFSPLWYVLFSKTLIFFNCSINPILYNMMSGRFKNAFRRLLRGKDKDNKDFKNTCTIVLSRPSTATASMRLDDLRPFLPPEHENGCNLVEKM